MLNRYQFLTAKPMVYLANLSSKDYIRKKNKFLAPLAEYITSRGAGDLLIPMSCEFEQEVGVGVHRSWYC